MKTGDSSNLNLLPSQAKFQAARMKLQARLHHYMKIGGVIWAVAAVLVGVLYFGSGAVLGLRKQKYQQAMDAYRSMSQEIFLNQILKYRSKVLGQVLDERFEYSAAFETINSIFAEKAKVSAFELDRSNNRRFSLEVEANDKESVEFIESKTEEANKGKIEGVSAISFKGANYSVAQAKWLIEMEVQLK